jgi:hypothetical protein
MQRRITVTLMFALSTAAGAQTVAPAQRGWQISGLPALNFNADEGFGYGAIVQAFNYGNHGLRPYKYLIQPLVFLTTKGRRDVSVFFDAPHLIPGHWRLGAYLGHEEQLATPYYGIGNSTPHDEAKEDANTYYYRYGRKGVRFSTDLQHNFIGPLRFLVGVGARTTKIDATPFDSTGTLLNAQLFGTDIRQLQTNYARAGLVYDTRDQESGPTRGEWIEVLAQRAAKIAGGDFAFTRVTGTARGYWSLGDRLVLAERITAQNMWGSMPFYELSTVQGSFSDGEALGGSGSVRGWPKNRFIGKGVMFANNELRWRVSDFRLRHLPSALVLNGFVDAGRVWATGISGKNLLTNLHTGYGGGARLRYGQDFVVGLDVGHSKEAGAAMYIGLGYPF